MESWLAQYCINVTDLERTVGFYEALGLECTSRTDIQVAKEAILEHPGKGGKVQLAQQMANDGPIDMGSAFWKLYVNTNDIDRMYKAALDFGSESVSAPARADRWPVTIAFVKDPDGYLVEFVQRHPWLDGDDTTQAWLGQYCINVSDIDAAIKFWETLGLECTSQTDIQVAKEAILENTGQGRQGPTRAADVAGRPDRHGHRDVEALRVHRRLQGPLRPGRRCRLHVGHRAGSARALADVDRVRRRSRQLPGRDRATSRRRVAPKRAVTPAPRRDRTAR